MSVGDDGYVLPGEEDHECHQHRYRRGSRGDLTMNARITDDDVGKPVVTEGGQDIGVAADGDGETLYINVSNVDGSSDAVDTNPYSVSTNAVKTITDAEIVLYEGG